jgi:hypothetical protein
MTLNYTLNGAGLTGSQQTAVQTALNNVALMYDNLFRDPVTVNIDVNIATLASNIAGQNQPNYYTCCTNNLNQLLTPDASYQYMKSVLAADATTPLDATAIANLPTDEPAIFGSDYPVFTEAEGEALGFGFSGVDGTITFNLLDFSNNTYYFRDPSLSDAANQALMGSGQADFWAVLMHETDEELGTISFDGVSGYYMMSDLFRYSGNGVRSYTTTTNSGQVVYFSVDGGKTPIVYYNQNGQGDYGDFYQDCSSPLVQDWRICGGKIINLGAPEIQLLDAVGWDPAPEPDVLIFCAAGLSAIWLWRRRQSAY